MAVFIASLVASRCAQLRDELVSKGIKRVGVWNKGIDTTRFNPRFKVREGCLRSLLIPSNGVCFACARASRAPRQGAG